MDKFHAWFTENNTAITWFIIGVLTNNALYHLASNHLGSAALDLVLAGINYYFWKTRNV